MKSLLKGKQWELVEAWRRRKTKWKSFGGIEVSGFTRSPMGCHEEWVREREL